MDANLIPIYEGVDGEENKCHNHEERDILNPSELKYRRHWRSITEDKYR